MSRAPKEVTQHGFLPHQSRVTNLSSDFSSDGRLFRNYSKTRKARELKFWLSYLTSVIKGGPDDVLKNFGSGQVTYHVILTILTRSKMVDNSRTKRPREWN